MHCIITNPGENPGETIYPIGGGFPFRELGRLICDDIEITRRLIDLFFISVLLDAGDTWRYTEPTTGQVYERSEGIAVLVLIFSKAWESHYLTTRTSSEHRDALEALPVSNHCHTPLY
jgi:hypothetical protein